VGTPIFEIEPTAEERAKLEASVQQVVDPVRKQS
jgi:hypothetical protein